jgi:hypothetical protein
VRTERTARVKKKAPARKRTAKKAVSTRTVSLPKTAAPAASSSPDSNLLIGGLALVILVLGDTVFLALSTRFLRET